MSTIPALPIPLDDIEDAQQANHISASEIDFARRDILLLQAVYARKIEQRNTVKSLFIEGEGAFTLIFRSESQDVTLQLGAATKDLYQPVIDALEEKLLDLEVQIVRAHLVLERDLKEQQEEFVGSSRSTPDYAVAIQRLCTEAPAEVMVEEPAPSTPAPTPASPRHVPQRTTTTRMGAGSNPSREAAAA